MLSSTDTETSAAESWILRVGSSASNTGVRAKWSSWDAPRVLEAVLSGAVVATSAPFAARSGEEIGPVHWAPSAGLLSVRGMRGPAAAPWEWPAGALYVNNEPIESTFPDETAGRLVVAICVAQSNSVGADSPLANAPSGHLRHAARVKVLSSTPGLYGLASPSGPLVTVSEPIHKWISAYLGSDDVDGYAFHLVALNDFLDTHTGFEAVIVPRAVESSALATHWAISPPGPWMVRAIEDIVRVLRPNDVLVLSGIKGEREASSQVETGDPSPANNFAANFAARIAFLRSRCARPDAIAIYGKVADPGEVVHATGYATVRAQIQAWADSDPTRNGTFPGASYVDASGHYSQAGEVEALGHAAGAVMLLLVSPP